MTDAVQKARAAADAPAFAAVVVNGDDTFMATAGHRTSSRNVPVTRDDRWHIGSISKMMTSTLVARFVASGHLRWEATLGELLGEVVPGMLPQYRDATLRHVLAHRAGLRLNRDEFNERMTAYTQAYIAKHGTAGPAPIGFKEGDFVGDPAVDRRHWTMASLLEPPAAPLGASKRIYENGNYIVMATVLEAMTGQSWETLMTNEVFVPLAMRRAGFGPPGIPGQVAEPFGHHRKKDGTVEAFAPDGPRSPDNPPVLGPSGRVHVSLDDMARFMRDHIKGHRGESGLLPAEAYQTLHTPPFGDDYALGWIVRDSGGLGHGGTNGKWLAIVEIRPADNVGVFVATNLGPPDATAPAANQLIDELFALFSGSGSSL